MVCVGYNPLSQRLIRTAAQLAQALEGGLLAVHVVSAESEAPAYRALLEQNLELARELGATVVSERGDDIAQVLARVAQAHSVTQIVMGESARSRMQEVVRGSLVRQVLQASRGIDVYIVADPA
jgi:two-component system sensor histidine kinase KdpD